MLILFERLTFSTNTNNNFKKKVHLYISAPLSIEKHSQIMELYVPAGIEFI